MDYQTYINSTQWKNKRKQVLERDRHQCQTCLSPDDLEVHHKTYANLGNEPLDDLIALCHECHEAITAVIRRRRYSKRSHAPTAIERIQPTISEVQNVSKIELSTDERLPDVAAQRTNRRSPQQVRQGIKASIVETRQDGRRF